MNAIGAWENPKELNQLSSHDLIQSALGSTDGQSNTRKKYYKCSRFYNAVVISKQRASDSARTEYHWLHAASVFIIHILACRNRMPFTFMPHYILFCPMFWITTSCCPYCTSFVILIVHSVPFSRECNFSSRLP